MDEQKQATPATHIAPSVGRVVWFWAARQPVDSAEQPMRADICYVHDDGTVTLSVNDHAGGSFSAFGITLHQGDAAGCSLPRPFATWMPYQKGQAAKSDQLKADLLDMRQTALEAAQEALEDEWNKLQLDMLREQVRELRLHNDAQEQQNERAKAYSQSLGAVSGAGGIHGCGQQAQAQKTLADGR